MRIIYAIVTVAILIIACVIHWFAVDAIDFGDFFVDEFGWITILSVLALGGIVFGFIFWLWWAMLLITIGALIIGGIIGIIIWRKNKAEERELSKIEESKSSTHYKCKNCSATITKIVSQNAYKKDVKYKCEHCDIIYSKSDLYNIENAGTIIGGGKANEIELTDFEEEYFDACQTFDFRLHNPHTKNQIERCYEKIKERINNFEIQFIDNSKTIFTDSYDLDNSEKVVKDARDFLINHIVEIDVYLRSLSQEKIKQRYEYFLLINSNDDDE